MKITNPKTFVMFKNIELSKYLIHSRSFQWGSELPLLTAVRPGHSQPNNINKFYCQSYRMAILICFSHLACILICCAQKRFVRNPQFNPFNFLGSEKHNLRSVIICSMRVVTCQRNNAICWSSTIICWRSTFIFQKSVISYMPVEC